MPRGKNAKAMRTHNRACAAGRSTRGCSMTAQTQKKGKKYAKGETSQVGECQSKIQKVVVFGGVEYQIIMNLKNYCLISGQM
jgi:hypothetical protein